MDSEALKIMIFSMIGAFSVFGIFMFVLSVQKPKRKAPQPNAYGLSEFDVMALELGKNLLTDVYEASKEEGKIYFKNGYREYNAYDIPFAVEAIEKLLERKKQTDKTDENEDPFELN